MAETKGTRVGAAAGGEADVFDLLIVTDATASMDRFLRALCASLTEIIQISTLTGAFKRIGILAYRDHCDGKRLFEWSGWCYISDKPQDTNHPEEERVSESTHPRDKRIFQKTLLSFARNIQHRGGGDIPEATKTGLAIAHDVMRADATTVMFLYTDAPPHLPGTGGYNYVTELAALTEGSCGGFGSRFTEWKSAAQTLTGMYSGKRAVVHCIVERGMPSISQTSAYLSTVTGGVCLELATLNESYISKLTIGVLLAWMGVGKSEKSPDTVLASLKTFEDPESIGSLTEDDFIQRIPSGRKGALRSTPVAIGDLSDIVQPRATPLVDFSQRYAVDAGYQSLVTVQLKSIIERNPEAMTINPIFGKLWRAVSADRENPARDELITLFGQKVQEAKTTAVRGGRAVARGVVPTAPPLATWLAESYDFTAEITKLIRGVKEESQFPCVYLDPTQDFTSKGATGDGADTRPLNEFTRDELLEIGRSCDYRVLQRLGKVLTRLSYVERAEDLPAHVRTAGLAVVPRIPLVLATKENKRVFWTVLLHVVLPGTKLGRRAATLLAALSLRMGMRPLRDVADEELKEYRGLWNTLEIPETWNLSCLNLLLDADKDYRRRVSDTKAPPADLDSYLLLGSDKKLFETLVDYKMLELNLLTTLTAKVGWTPEKTKLSLGPHVICRQCNYPRSVTVMAKDGICGKCDVSTNCTCSACTKGDNHEANVGSHVTKADNETTDVTWVECSVKNCRTQYVVYNSEGLRVRPKCFYCRHNGQGGHEAGRNNLGPAPYVECTKCLNRMTYPHEYRPKDMDLSTWKCVSCTLGRMTIVDVETTAKALNVENGLEWLLTIKNNALPDPLAGRSLFYTASNCTLDTLFDNVTVIPPSSAPLVLNGKPVHNTPDLTSSLRTWVLSRRTESGECSLCFSSTRKTSLITACGRSGCRQLICDSCRGDWYGLNVQGKIINFAALSCPFCRRTPAPGVISRFGITRMGNGRAAVEEAGEWVHAWCGVCGFAKRYAERVCERAVPGGIEGWVCEECIAIVRDAEGDDGVGIEGADGALGGKPRGCPGCGVMTEKTMGCDHISCPCGVHWCYACGEKAEEDTIYAHISSRHGGLWGGEWDDDEYGDDGVNEEE
ncbi:uncharacterized protein DNG_08936 [Cephalotrichum gorgonifer]|uniref:RING-type domain-containing protein n=1 Tax=Cephalotrichum gorgonifer TaxID=2041049 RepID=A0AAE8N4Y7_9PEZI|nr:uncharacterized protein DNG_08936 [Cephalotrichum gorgonifer]